jgi:hypothetical protein
VIANRSTDLVALAKDFVVHGGRADVAAICRRAGVSRSADVNGGQVDGLDGGLSPPSYFRAGCSVSAAF